MKFKNILLFIGILTIASLSCQALMPSPRPAPTLILSPSGTRQADGSWEILALNVGVKTEEYMQIITIFTIKDNNVWMSTLDKSSEMGPSVLFATIEEEGFLELSGKFGSGTSSSFGTLTNKKGKIYWIPPLNIEFQQG
jgi:hypothetical protein